MLLGQGWNGEGLTDVESGGCDVIGRRVGMLFQIGGECGQGWNLAVCV